MNNKIIIYIIMFLTLILSVNAGMVEKPLNISIANCYNITIEADLNNGKPSDVQFNGCNKIDNENFYCNCYNTNNNNFSIIMQTDNTLVRDLREYDIKIKVNYFNFNYKSITVPVTDGGDYYELYNSKWTYLGIENKTYRIVEKPVYINNITYIDKVIEVPVEKIVYQDKIITQIEYINITVERNITEYVENTTRIDELNKSNDIRGYAIFILSLFIVCYFTVIFFKWYKNEKTI